MRRLKVDVLRPAAQWAQEGGVTFEAEKTGLIHFERRPSEQGRLPVLRFLGRTIESQDKVKVLGVILDSKLRLKLHIDKVVQTATKKCLAIRRLRGIRPKQMRQLYRAVVAPTVDYAASAWFARGRWGTQDHITRLNRVQRLGAQAIIGAFRMVSTAVLQDEAGLEPVESRLAWRTARHTLDARSLPRTHPLWAIMNTMQARPDRHKSPLFQTWLRYNTAIPQEWYERLRSGAVLSDWVVGHDIPEADALHYVLRYTAYKDVSARISSYSRRHGHPRRAWMTVTRLVSIYFAMVLHIDVCSCPHFQAPSWLPLVLCPTLKALHHGRSQQHRGAGWQPKVSRLPFTFICSISGFAATRMPSPPDFTTNSNRQSRSLRGSCFVSVAGTLGPRPLSAFGCCSYISVQLSWKSRAL